jgi:hypothetical protein
MIAIFGADTCAGKYSDLSLGHSSKKLSGERKIFLVFAERALAIAHQVSPYTSPRNRRGRVYHFMILIKTQLHPLVEPHVSHFSQVPFRTMVKLWHSEHSLPV